MGGPHNLSALVFDPLTTHPVLSSGRWSLSEFLLSEAAKVWYPNFTCLKISENKTQLNKSQFFVTRVTKMRQPPKM